MLWRMPADTDEQMIGGIVVATLLTLLFLPALYVAWYRIREPA